MRKVFIFSAMSLTILSVIFLIFYGSTYFMAKKITNEMNKEIVEIREKHKQIKEEALIKGIKTEALIVEKDIKSTLSSIMLIPAYSTTTVVPTNNQTTNYIVRLYALKDDYYITVSQKIYEQLTEGTYIECTVYKDKIYLNLDKNDKSK
ncbi:Uncharacterised protein [Lysinibacillus capsici]|uniref:Uncharacterized protein n=1 Tax=Lysinibacillus capsici TaxID=2115968 RepID=A0A2X1A938_9BACI|nr:hypothetical protein [Lysinibacillus capsici]SPU40667.1 Uncharacterised protein [Lysinibacillus capsici]